MNERLAQKMVSLNNGKRTAIRLDSETWNAADRIAKQDGVSVGNLITAIIDTIPNDEVNRTAFIREEIMKRIFGELTALSEENQRLKIEVQVYKDMAYKKV